MSLPSGCTQEVLRIGLILFCFFPDIRGKINIRAILKAVSYLQLNRTNIVTEVANSLVVQRR